MNGERYDSSVGDDMGLFGYAIYKNSWFQLERDLKAFDQAVEASHPRSSLTIKTGGPHLKFYRGGADETFDIETYELDSTSITKRDIPANNAYQLDIFSQNQTTESEQAELGPLDLTGWITVHSGNPDDGLLSVWMGAPRMPTYDNPSPWAFVFHMPDLCAARGCHGGQSGFGVSITPPPSAPRGPSHGDRQEPDLGIERHKPDESDDEST